MIWHDGTMIWHDGTMIWHVGTVECQVRTMTCYNDAICHDDTMMYTVIIYNDEMSRFYADVMVFQKCLHDTMICHICAMISDDFTNI